MDGSTEKINPKIELVLCKYVNDSPFSRVILSFTVKHTIYFWLSQKMGIFLFQLRIGCSSSPFVGMFDEENLPTENEYPLQDVPARRIVRNLKDLSEWAQTKYTIVQQNNLIQPIITDIMLQSGALEKRSGLTFVMFGRAGRVRSWTTAVWRWLLQ